MIDIRRWPINDKLQLPDQAFGRRWIIGVNGVAAVGDLNYYLGNHTLPEWCIIWQIVLTSVIDGTGNYYFSFRLGDVVPANEAEFLRLQPVFDQQVDDNGNESSWRMTQKMVYFKLDMKHMIHSMGRRIVFGAGPTSQAPTPIGYNMTISSIPNEVPEWLISEEVKDRRL